jgi:hypothetical protein
MGTSEQKAAAPDAQARRHIAVRRVIASRANPDAPTSETDSFVALAGAAP